MLTQLTPISYHDGLVKAKKELPFFITKQVYIGRLSNAQYSIIRTLIRLTMIVNIYAS